jgi:hypothetical protein
MRCRGACDITIKVDDADMRSGSLDLAVVAPAQWRSVQCCIFKAECGQQQQARLNNWMNLYENPTDQP